MSSFEFGYINIDNILTYRRRGPDESFAVDEVVGHLLELGRRCRTLAQVVRNTCCI